jgi:hypothetical protein
MPVLKIHEQQKEWAIKAAAGTVTALLCYAVMVHPVFQDRAFLRQKIADSQKRVALYREVLALTENLTGREKALAALNDRSVLLGRISDLANQNQIDIQTLTPRTSPEGNYLKLQVELQGTSSFFSALKFLQAVEKMNAAVKVKEISILRQRSQETPGKKYPLQVHLVFETFLKQRVKKDNV